MDDVLAVSRLVLAVPFAVAGLRKLADPFAARQAMAATGVPPRLVNGTVAALTLGETAVAIGLVPAATAGWSAVLALVCLLVTVLPAARGIARRGGSAAGLPVVIRAHVLAAPAVVVVWAGSERAGPDLLAWWWGLGIGPRIAIAAGVAALVVVSGGVRPRRPAPPEWAPLVAARPPVPAVPLIRPGPALTIGMATYDDFDGVYFTIQALRLYQDMDDTELLVVDNYGCEHTRDFVSSWAGGRYVLANDVTGTAGPKDLVVRSACGAAVLCCDSHVLLEPGVVARLKAFYRDNPSCADLLQGPLVYDDGSFVSTHFDPVWREQMWGIWATDPRGVDPDGEPFDIPMQGLGVFSCRADAWLGFHPGFRGFGGEEGYLHEKYRRAGRRCLCLPWLRWMHRFGRPRGTPYPLTIEDKLRNYVLGHTELGLDLAPVTAHFAQYLPADQVTRIVERTVAEPLV